MKYVIIGGDAAGMSAAMEIYRHDQNAQITTLEKGYDYSYGQCGLPYVVDGRIASTDEVVSKTAKQFRQKYQIDTRVGHEVTHIDPRKNEVSGLHNGETFTFFYDRLLIATGAEPARLKVAGAHLKNIQTFKTIVDTNKLKDQLQGIHHITIVGGGYIGLELAEVLREAGKEVRMLVRGKQVAKFLDQEMAQKILAVAQDNGVEVLTETTPTKYVGTHSVEAVETNTGVYETDYVIEAIGVRPNTQFLRDSGIYTMDNGAILVNPHMETSLQHIYAAGDCATHFHRVKQRNDFIPLGTTANKQGRIAGLNMANFQVSFHGIVGTSILKFFDLAIGKTGLSEIEAQKMNYPYEVYIQEAGDRASYYPNRQMLDLKIIWHKETERLLGLQVLGKSGVDKRVDVFATALYAKSTLGQLLDLDLSYAPPFNSVWDPIQQLAKRQF